RLLHRRDSFLAVLLNFSQSLHDRADGFRDALACALFAIEHALAKFAGENVLALVEAFRHARDLLAHMLNRLRTALLNRTDALFEALGETPDFEAHAIKRRGFAALDLVEAVLQRGRHARQFFANRGGGGVIVASLNRAEALINRLRHALDLDRDRLDRLRLAAFGGGKAAVHIRQRLFDAFAADHDGLQFLGDFFANRLRHRIEALLEHRADRFGLVRRAAALFDAGVERGDRLFDVADRRVGGGFRFIELISQTLQRAVERFNRVADLINLGRVGCRRFNAGDARFERGEGPVERAIVALGFKRGEALCDILLSLAEVAEVNRARLASNVFNLLDAGRGRELRVAQIRDRGARSLTKPCRAFACGGFRAFDARDQARLLSLQCVDSADALGDLVFKTDDFFKQRFARAAGFARRFRANFRDRGFNGAPR